MNKSQLLKIGLVIALAGLAIFFFVGSRSSGSETKEDQAKRITERVSKLIDIPDETPSVAKVDDKTKLSDEVFFANAKNGDFVLIFKRAQKAVLYRESTNRIVNVGPVTIESKTATTAKPKAQEQSKPRIDVVAFENDSNQTKAKLETEIGETADISQVDSAEEFNDTIVLINNADLAELANQIAELTNGEVGAIPQGGQPSDADIVVYLRS